MSKDPVEGLSFKPFRFLREFLGVNKFEIQEGKHIFKLGKDCAYCGKSIIHRDVISVCQCYCFAHKNCLKNQLRSGNVAECSVVQCRECKKIVNAKIQSSYFFEINFTVGDLLVLFICAALCAASVAYLVNFKNSQLLQMKQEEIKTHHQKNTSQIKIQEIIPLSVLFAFGITFWLCLIGMVLRKKTRVKDIEGTNTEVKVSAFEQLQIKIREESLQQITTKKHQINL